MFIHFKVLSIEALTASQDVPENKSMCNLKICQQMHSYVNFTIMNLICLYYALLLSGQFATGVKNLVLVIKQGDMSGCMEHLF